MIGTATIEQYDQESVLNWNFYPEELNTMKLLGVKTMGDLIRRYDEINEATKLFEHLRFVKDEAIRLGFTEIEYEKQIKAYNTPFYEGNHQRLHKPKVTESMKKDWKAFLNKL